MGALLVRLALGAWAVAWVGLFSAGMNRRQLAYLAFATTVIGLGGQERSMSRSSGWVCPGMRDKPTQARALLLAEHAL
jgi:hypothetical protein